MAFKTMRFRIPLLLPNTGSMYRRRNYSYCILATITTFLILFILLQIHYFTTFLKEPFVDHATSDSTVLSMVPSAFHKFLKAKTKNQTFTAPGTLNGSQNGYIEVYQPPNITEIKRVIAKYNKLQVILNQDTFGPIQNDSVIIVVQVHTRITYLRHLIASLAKARDISKTLLIFSHDYYDEDINDLVQTIDFCKVMQIFYPFSIQTHPNEFPGVDPGDCPRDIEKDHLRRRQPAILFDPRHAAFISPEQTLWHLQLLGHLNIVSIFLLEHCCPFDRYCKMFVAIIQKCNNALYPDLFGHYREARFAQIKHHWWWKANRVFDQLEVTRFHTGLVLFLEEDHYVAEDFLYLLELMREQSDLCPQCNVLSLGTYFKKSNDYTYSREQQVEVMPWSSNKHNMGFAINQSTWYSIQTCADYFCFYDDYNWDWSLQHASQECLTKKLHAMIVKGPRVFHIGECGVHHNKKDCEPNQVISIVQQMLRRARNAEEMFPGSLTLTSVGLIKMTKSLKGNGGWGDPRDRQLCLNMTLPTR